MAYRRLTHETSRLLKKKLPAAFTVRVRSAQKLDPQYQALCSLEGSGKQRYFLIRISKRLSDEQARDALIHEYAHAVSWGHLHDQQEDHPWHDDVWGVNYARVYRVANEDEEDSFHEK